MNSTSVKGIGLAVVGGRQQQLDRCFGELLLCSAEPPQQFLTVVQQQKVQAKAWFKKAVVSGRVKKLNQPVRHSGGGCRRH